MGASTPATPVLASTLYAARHTNPTPNSDSVRVRTGISPIDTLVLDGAFEARTSTANGVVAGIAFERFSGINGVANSDGDDADFASLILHSTLATYLSSTHLSSTGLAAPAFVIDPTGAFDARRLLRLLLASGGTCTGNRSAAMRLMERASVMRVFGEEGILDALGEVREVLDGNGAAASGGGPTSSGTPDAVPNDGGGRGAAPANGEDVDADADAHMDVDADVQEQPPREDNAAAPHSDAPAKTASVVTGHDRTVEIPDSDDEDALEIEFSQPDMARPDPVQAQVHGQHPPSASSPLPPSSPPHVHPHPHTTPSNPQQPLTHQTPNQTTPSTKPSQQQQPPLLLLPTLHPVLAPLQSSNPTRAAAILAHLVSRLRGLARDFGAVVLLGNSTAGGGAPGAPGVPGGNHDKGDPETQARAAAAPGPSSFLAPLALRPALGRVLASGLDLSVLCWRWRDGVSDSDSSSVSKQYGTTHHHYQARSREHTDAEKGNVDAARLWAVEVLHDRYGARGGRWVVVRLENGDGEEGVVRVTGL